jgi:eukaryotic-like serine/threonine-protein kinase
LLPYKLQAGVPGFGYIRPLRDPRFKTLVDMIHRGVEPTFRVLTTVGLELSHRFLQLHAKGLCFRAIGLGNILFDPITGGVILCNDNVTVDGTAQGEILLTSNLRPRKLLRGGEPPGAQLATLLFTSSCG